MMKPYIYLVLIWALLMCLIALSSCASAPAAVPVAITEVRPVLSWEKDHPERKSWSFLLHDEVFSALPTFDKAKDAESFCPKYKALSDEKKILVWSEMIVRIAYHESRWNPKTKFQEPPPPKGPGTLSVGLLQLSKSDRGCPKTTEGLMDPIKNLQCGVGLMKHFIEKDGLIAQGKLGVARYWSVTRPGHHIDEIKKHTRSLPNCN